MLHLLIVSDTFSVNICSYGIELQAVKFYTRPVFVKLQKMLSASTGYLCNQVLGPPDVAGLNFELVSNHISNARVYQVNVVLEEERWCCSCKYFERNGIICSHIIRTMVQLNVQEIPQRYLLDRWSEAATTSLGGTGQPLDFGLPTTNTLRYNALCRKLTWIASDACFSDHTYKLLSDAVDQIAPVIAAARRDARQQEQQEAEAEQQPEEQHAPATTMDVPVDEDEPVTYQNPPRVKPKGRPTVLSKRKKPLLEQREEKIAKKNKGKKPVEQDPTNPGDKAQKKPRKESLCSFCQEPGHKITTCQMAKLAKESLVNDLKREAANEARGKEDDAEASRS